MTDSMKLFSSLLVLFAVSVCSGSQLVEAVAVEQEEYAVYSAMIPLIYGARHYVIANPTFYAGSPKSKDVIPFNLPAGPSASQQTFNDFLRRNKSNGWLTRKLDLQAEYVLVDFAEIKTIASFKPQDDWKEFHHKYPEAPGYITLSRVGFNERRNQALVLTRFVCHPMCVEGVYVLLAKAGGAWKVVNTARASIS